MTRYRPTGVLVIAILHLVFGGLGLLMDLCGLAAQLGAQKVFLMAIPEPQRTQQLQVQEKMEQTIEERLPGNKLINIGEQVLALAFDGMLLTAGVGLLSMRPWARTLSLTYAALSIINRILITAYTVIFVMPAMKLVMD